MIATEVTRPLAAVTFLVLCFWACCSSAKGNQKAVLDDIRKYDTCVYKTVFSFVHTEYNPPITQEKMKEVCRTQSEGFKCLKEQTKGAPPIIRRGLLTMVATRQRQHRRLCANTESENAKRFVAASKCIMQNSLPQLEANDKELERRLGEVLRRNYNDSAPELKQICCTMYIFKKTFYDVTEKACSSHKSSLEDILTSILTEDITLLCDDDEKLAKLCPKLDKLEGPPNTKPQSGVSLTLYLVSTLGEADETLPQLD